MDSTYPQWLKIDLGKVSSIGGYQATWYSNTSRSYKYKIELSNDDVNYNLAVDRQTNTQTGIYKDRTPALSQFTGRYVKLTVVGGSAGSASLYEFQVFGAPGISATPTPTQPVTPTPTPKPATPTPTQPVTPTPTPKPVTPTPTQPVTPTPTPKPVTPTPTQPVTPTPTPSGVQLLSQGQPVSSSPSQANNPATAGNDGNLTTRWCASGTSFPQWWRVDLGSIKNLTKVDINWYSSSSRYYKYKIEVSSDDTNYTTVVDKSSNTNTGDTSDSFTATGRYVRVTTTSQGSSSYSSFNECKVYGN